MDAEYRIRKAALASIKNLGYRQLLISGEGAILHRPHGNRGRCIRHIRLVDDTIKQTVQCFTRDELLLVSGLADMG